MAIFKVTRAARKVLKLKYCGAVIVAAGTASRMGGIDKLMEELRGVTVIKRSVQAFEDCDAIKEIVIVTRTDLILPIQNLCAPFKKVTAIVAGGETRPQSVQAGMNALSKKVKLVAVHDGARPLVSVQLIDRVVRGANSYGAAVPGLPVKDTVKEANGGIVKQTLDRSSLYAVQTHQAFDFDLLRGALDKTKLEDAQITDDASAVENMGMSVKMVVGDERNIKITTPLDLRLAEILIEET